MTKILEESFFALYNQIGLYDTEDKESYPLWETGLELVVFGNKGIAVSVKGDTDVLVKIITNQVVTSDLFFYGSWQIMVGKKGLTVGNEIAANTRHIDWEEGLTLINVYGNSRQNEATEIIFLLKTVPTQNSS